MLCCSTEKLLRASVPPPAFWGRLLWVVVLMGIPGVLPARTWIVDQGGAGDFLTVTEACEAASSGDSVLIHPGDYNEWNGTNAIVLESKSISVIGAGPRPEDVALQLRLFCMSSDLFLLQLLIRGVDKPLYASGYSTVIVRSCRFEDNYDPGPGGAIEMGTASLLVEDSFFTRNRAGMDGGAIHASNPVIRRSVFLDNTATGHGGAVWNGGSLTLEDCIFLGNEAANGAAVTVALTFDSTLRGCTFLNNRTALYGAAIEVYSGGIYPIDHCIVAGTVNGYGIGCWDIAEARCCDSWGNEFGEYAGACGWADFWGDFSADPLFCDAVGGDVGLREGSPCLPGNHGGVECGLIGAKGLGCIVGTKALSWGRVKSLFR